ncbi:MAG TPA: hypothetical protein VMC02_10225 [Steroidobacteraceae bacterium]|nr:hypothetical protein [Steroidobacteraceae bacterium]
MTGAKRAALGALAVGAFIGVPVHAADPCDGFTWNVTHERAVFATPAVAVTAAAAAGAAPVLEVDRLYDISLTPQEKVGFVLAPAKKALADGAFAGLVTLHIPTAGKYRVSMSEGFWIDVIADGKFAPTDDFTGLRECRAPRKIVQYPLPAGDLVLQFSNTNSAAVRVTVTAAPK